MKDREYREAWENFKEELLQDYIEQRQRVERVKRRNYEGYPKTRLSDVAYERGKLGQMTVELHFLDELDGTNEFSNILHDTNRSE
ncbi:hypothetical protein [Mammaliicoccus sciuri]|uniref:hypothetical protein n=1 Tax=Mammaliicoccus sciuri TaxID=1296 RepID=UPI0021D03A33|nr:hypothetical protein [Mammaliicoccus sciuri]UXV30011.1 hypothetical protein MUA76_03100 [Mammaliicoccus sciuri]